MDWVVLLMPLTLWLKAVYGSPYVKTYRHPLSASLAIVAGILLFASARLDKQVFPFLFWSGAGAFAAMAVSLLWAPSHRPRNGS